MEVNTMTIEELINYLQTLAKYSPNGLDTEVLIDMHRNQTMSIVDIKLETMSAIDIVVEKDLSQIYVRLISESTLCRTEDL